MSQNQPFRPRVPELSYALRRWQTAGTAVLGLLVALGLACRYLPLGEPLPRAPFRQTSRLYGRVPHLIRGEAAADVVSLLTSSGYLEVTGERPLVPGTFRRVSHHLTAALRRFPTPAGMRGGEAVDITFESDRIARLSVGGKETAGADLEPPVLASYYGPDVVERRPVALAELPQQVVLSVLAAEDDAFFAHSGLSAPGIARALWVDLRGGKPRQGGSTITQQLVKNLFLTGRRTLGRKLLEAGAALVLELRYSKRQILETYLNEIYWGRSGAVNLVGLGAAARSYFGKDAAALSLAEAAALAGMIRAPSEY
ncbi:MAG: transglycosylase domain-containing protein, partial [Acidobacteriota bacterium]|nr:transglycosylase domain-containing protein [Acidobacteriota bacterium]